MSNLQPSRPLNVGIVGLGYWGPNLLRVLGESESTELTWICDRDEDRLATIGRRAPSARRTTDFADLLDDDALDAICVATPVFSHAPLARQALLAGKHVFVEKPLADSTAAADELIELAQGRGLVLMCGHTFLYSPPVQYVGEQIRSGALGDIYFVTASRVNLGLHQRDVSVIWDLAPHDFSILLSWFDERPTSVRASGRDSIVKGVHDVAFVQLEFPSGLIANVEVSWLAPSKLRRTAIVGSERMVLYEDGAREPVRVFDSGVVYQDPETFGEYHLSYRSGDIVSPRIDTFEPLAAQMQDFATFCRDGRSDHPHRSLGRDVVALLEAADRSLVDGGETVVIPTSPLQPTHG
jgi:predicted dehydrogenase